MDRRSPALGSEADEPTRGEAHSADARSDAALDHILPPIDEDDPAWQAYARRKIRESLDDPRPDIPAEEAFADIDRHIAEYKAKRGL